MFIKNPFTIGLVTEQWQFCDRQNELNDLLRHARSASKVVICSPRRYGKSSLAQIVLSRLRKEDFLTAYVDLFPVSSEQDFILRLASSIYKGMGKVVDPRTFVDKVRGLFTRIIPTIDVGPDGYSISAKFSFSEKTDLLLDDIMEGLEKYVGKGGKRACVVMDEFQEITELQSSKKIEGILRSHSQHHDNISYFYIGSRRRILKDMFMDKSRPFYKSAFFYSLKEIPSDDFVPYIVELFKKTEKRCPQNFAKEIYDRVRGYPYYVQKLSSIAWEETEEECNEDIVRRAFQQLVQTESVDFEGIWSGLSMVQKTVLKTIAVEPGAAPYSKDKLEKSRVSIGGIQKALKLLIERDIVERMDDGIYRLTDPVMEAWLKN